MGILGKLENTFTEVNEQLSKLEDAIDIEQLSTKKLDHVKQLKSYKQKKHVEMEVAKGISLLHFTISNILWRCSADGKEPHPQRHHARESAAVRAAGETGGVSRNVS